MLELGYKEILGAITILMIIVGYGKYTIREYATYS